MNMYLRMETVDMITYNALKSGGLNKYCRECMNRKYHLSLATKDCEYIYFPRECKRCGEVKNIVRDIKIFSRWKLLGS